MIAKNKMYKRLSFSTVKLFEIMYNDGLKAIKNKTNNIIKVCIPNKPLNPSIRLEPFIINKKHKQIKNSAKISIFKR